MTSAASTTDTIRAAVGHLPRRMLDEAICRKAQVAGVQLCENRPGHRPGYGEDRVAGVRVSPSRHAPIVGAPVVVVAADGADSQLAQAAGLYPGARNRCRDPRLSFRTGRTAGPREIFLPLIDIPERHFLLRTAGFIPPGRMRRTSASAFFNVALRTPARELARTFMTHLRTERTSVRRIPRQEDGHAGPVAIRLLVRSHCAERGILLVGDAAGLVSPFTGEGVSYALDQLRQPPKSSTGAWTLGGAHTSICSITRYCLRIRTRDTSRPDGIQRTDTSSSGGCWRTLSTVSDRRLRCPVARSCSRTAPPT